MIGPVHYGADVACLHTGFTNVVSNFPRILFIELIMETIV